MPRFSIIIPVYNRPNEVKELLESLCQQTCTDFEVVIVEDGSSLPCNEVVREYSEALDVKYFFKENRGRSIARNYGMERSEGSYLIFFDSDCVIPREYIRILSRALDADPLDCFGCPDAAHESFSSTQ